MVKQKATITVDRAKLAEACALLDAPSASSAIDIALSEVIRRARVRRDVDAYRRSPQTGEETDIGEALPGWADLADDTDWEAEWPDEA